MGCKHRQTNGKTTNYYFCNIKEKVVDNYMDCRDCPLKIEDRKNINEIFEQIFRERI